MPTGLAPRRLPRAGALVMAIVALGLAAAPGARADTIAAKREQARQVEKQIEVFDMRLEAAIQAYDGARVQLAQVKRQIRANRARLRIARANLRAAQADLARLVVSAYKGGGEDVTAYVLASRSFGDLLDRVDTVDRLSKSEGEILARIARTEREIARRQQELRREEAKARKLVAERAKRRHQIEVGLAQRRQMLASIKSDIKRLIRQAELRRERLARARAAAAARREAAREAAQKAAEEAQQRAAAAAAAQAQSSSAPAPSPSA
jgi:peptidoglycan hydrolase CwlO-like protein